MNCRRTRELLSPYSDGRLTGAQMLEVAQHMERCAGCRDEYHVIQDVKVLLRAVSRPQPESALEHEIRKRIATEEAISQINLCLSFSVRPQRAKRMVTAVALSCFSVLVVAAPFGAGTLALSYSRQAAKHSSSSGADHAGSQDMLEFSGGSEGALFASGGSVMGISSYSQMRRSSPRQIAPGFAMTSSQGYGSFASQEFGGMGASSPFFLPARR